MLKDFYPNYVRSKGIALVLYVEFNHPLLVIGMFGATYLEGS